MSHRFAIAVLSFGMAASWSAADAPPASPTPSPQAPFRLVFKAYNGDPGITNPKHLEFQIDTIDLRQPSSFLKLGDMIPGTPFKLSKFTYKTGYDKQVADIKDVSELTIINVKTKQTVVLILDRVIDASGKNSAVPQLGK